MEKDQDSQNERPTLKAVIDARFAELAKDIPPMSDFVNGWPNLIYGRETTEGNIPKTTIFLPMTVEMLMDAGLLRYEGPPLPPPSRMERFRRIVRQRYWGARWWLAEKVAGQPIYDRYGDEG